MKNLFWVQIAFVAILTLSTVYAEVEAPDLKLGGFSSLRLGQVIKGEPETVVGTASKNTNVWVQQLDLGLSLEATFKHVPAVGKIGLEMAVNTDNAHYAGDLGKSRLINRTIYPSQADLLFTLLDDDKSKLELDVGYFPYKYNNSVTNLGEYLFRSGTYPGYLITDFDFPIARLLGLRFGGSLLESKLNFDVILTTNYEWTAIGDINLSGLLAWKPLPAFELGVGGSWNSLISVDIDNTTPLDPGSQYLAYDPVVGDTAIYNYTFAGQKLMGRLSFDILKFFPENDFFGKEDFKLYTEAAILGLINYPMSRDSLTQYEDIFERMPIMFGFNLPTHPLLSYTVVPALMTIGLNNAGKIDGTNFVKPSTFVAAGAGALSGIGLYLLEKKFNIKTGLDVLSFEIEYYGSPYPNNLNSIRFDNVPLPLSSMQKEMTRGYTNLHNDDWKWSLYFKKTIADNFFIRGQFARDHFRWFRSSYAAMDGKEALRENDDWYFMFKFGYSF